MSIKIKTKPTHGIKHDAGKPAFDLLPMDAVLEVVKVITFGASLYTPGNWRKVEKHRYFGAILRHLVAAQLGEELDPQSGMRHLAHAATDILFLMSYGPRQRYERPNE